MSSPTLIPIQREHFDEVRATQAAAWLLKKTASGISASVLTQLLYLSDREALSRFGYAITTDRYGLVDHLPVLQNIQSLLNKPQRGFWNLHIISNHGVRLINDPGRDQLSNVVENILDIVLRVYGPMGDVELFRHVRTLPECDVPEHTPVDYRSILKAVGRSPEDIELIAGEIENVNTLERLLMPKGNS